MNDINFPKLAVEYVAIVSHSIAIIALFVVGTLKLREHIYKPSSNRLRAALIAYGFWLGQIFDILVSFPYPSPYLLVPEVWFIYPTSCFYVFFQINCLRVMAGHRMRKWANAVIYGLYALTILMFFGCLTPLILRYLAWSPETDTGFWMHWREFEIYWAAYVVLIDIGLNLILLRIIFTTSRLFTNSNQTGHSKTYFLSLCVAVVLFDCVGAYVSLQIPSETAGIDSFRTARAYYLFIGTVTSLHIATGLYYLTAMVSAQTAATKLKSKSSATSKPAPIAQSSTHQ